MEKYLEKSENIGESVEAISEVENGERNQITLLENLELAKKEGNTDAVAYYEKQLAKFSVDKKLNDESDVSLGSCCEDFCQKTFTNRTHGNYTRNGR